MKLFMRILIPVFLLSIILLIGRHYCVREPLTFLSVRVTEFEIERAGKSLQFPLTIGVLDSAQAVRDVDEAEYFYHKLSSLYDFKRFSYLSSTTLDTALRGSAERAEQLSVFNSSGGGGILKLVLEAYTGSEAKFRLTRIGADTVNYPFAAESGRSVSVGLTSSADSAKGTLLIVTAWLLKTSIPAEEAPVLRFLAEKNRVRSSAESAAPIYFASDQAILDANLGKDAIKLPISEVNGGASGGGDGVVNPDSLDEHPFAVSNLPDMLGKLIYPESAKRDGVQGTVIISFLVDSAGSVKEVKLIRGVRPDLDSAACAIFGSVVFHPPRKNGAGVNVWLTLPIRFALK